MAIVNRIMAVSSEKAHGNYHVNGIIPTKYRKHGKEHTQYKEILKPNHKSTTFTL